MINCKWCRSFQYKKAVHDELLFYWINILLFTLPVPREAPLWLQCKRSEQTKLCAAYFVSGQSSAGEGTQPSGYERQKLKQQQAVMMK
jgi:hypothetical protein